MFPRSIFSIRIITTILAISIIINNINIIIKNRVSSQPFGMRSVCCRRRSRSPVAVIAWPRSAVKAWRLEVVVLRSEVNGVGPLGVLEVLPWAYGPSEQSLFEWMAFLHTDMIDQEYGNASDQDLADASEWFLDYSTSPIYY